MAPPLKILLIHSFFDARGGDSTYVEGLEAELRQTGHDVRRFSMNSAASGHVGQAPEIDYPKLARSSILLAGAVGLGLGIFNLPAARALDRLLQSWRPDVAHVHHLHRHLTPAILHPLNQRRVPVVWTVHDYELLCPTGHFFRAGGPCEECRVTRFDRAVKHRCKRGSAAASLLMALEKGAHRGWGITRRVATFVAPSRFMAQKLIEYGFDRMKVQHIPNFAPAGDLMPDTAHGNVVYIGRLSAEKGVKTLVDVAIAGIAAPLVIVGDGPERIELERLARPMMPGKVRFLGAIPHPSVGAVLAQAAVVVVPSLWYENCPFSVLEAMAAGRAVVASRIGGIPELINHGRTGHLLTPGAVGSWRDTLDMVLREGTYRRELAANAAAAARQQFGIKEHLARILQLYWQVVEARGGGLGGVV